MQIANEMDDVAGGVRTLAGISLRIFQDGELLGDGLGDAAGLTAETCEWPTGSAAGDVNIVPRAVFQRVANIVGPGGAVGEQAAGKRAAVALELRIDRIFLEQRF